MSEYDISNFHVIHDDQRSEVTDEETTEGYFYTIKGQETFIDKQNFPRINGDLTTVKEDSKVFAYKVQYTNPNGHESEKYYVKRGKHGRLFNPIGLFSEGNSGKIMKHSGKLEWTLQSVNQKCFDYYINFLRTRNEAHLSNAERQVM